MVCLVVLLVAAIVASIPFSSEALRQRVVATLSDRLDSQVEIAAVRLQLLPRFHAEGAGLAIRRKDQHDGPPLISIKTVTIDANLASLLRRHVSQVSVDGLEVHIQTKSPKPRPATAEDASRRPARAGAVAGGVRDIVIENLIASDAQLIVTPIERIRPPHVWSIHQLHMRALAFDRAAPFKASLTNAIPPGEIETQGLFGPWNAADPGQSPLEGTFTFANADLSIFTGVAGVLTAHGEFGGSLSRIGVHGETETPDFTLSISGHRVALHTDYHSTVDGLNGDTLLDRIDARFLHSSLVAEGSIVGTRGKEGRTVTLNISMDRARLEDALWLAVKGRNSPMTGDLRLTTRLVIPPGHRDIADRLRLNGQFTVARAQFTEIDVQQKIDELSRRSRGNRAVASQRVVSNFNGRFDLANADLALRPVTFATDGAAVELTGMYQLRPESLSFNGTLSMAAKVSDTQSGFKRLLLKAIDPLFNKSGGGSAIPIKVGGTLHDPQFGLDRRRLFKRNR
jgi:hypothetical protein